MLFFAAKKNLSVINKLGTAACVVPPQRLDPRQQVGALPERKEAGGSPPRPVDGNLCGSGSFCFLKSVCILASAENGDGLFGNKGLKKVDSIPGMLTKNNIAPTEYVVLATK